MGGGEKTEKHKQQACLCGLVRNVCVDGLEFYVSEA